MERALLINARKARFWTQAEAAKRLGVELSTLRRWEHGTSEPQPVNLARICGVYEATPRELGLTECIDIPVQQSIKEEMLPFQQQDLTLRLLRIVWRLPHTTTPHTLQMRITEELNHTMNEDLTRRDALRRLALLPIEMSGLSLMSITLQAPEPDILAQCAAGLVACWNLRKGRELADVSYNVSRYIPTLKLIAQQSSTYRKPAADLLAQCYLLKCLLAWHVETHAESITYAQQAATYSEVAGNTVMHVLALRTQAAAHYYANHWNQALDAALHAKAVMETAQGAPIPQIAQSYVWAGLATYQAHHQQKQEAFTSLGKAHAAFFAQSSDEPIPPWIDHYTGNLVLNDGRTHLHLGMQQKALDSFAQIHADPAGSDAIRVEALLNEAIAEVYRAGDRDMEWVIEKWSRGIEGAKVLRSEQRFTEAIGTYAAMRAAWPAEPRIKALRERIAHW